MTETEITARGHTGTVTFDGAFITIQRHGVARVTIGKGSKQIPINQISTVAFKPAGRLVNGFVQFTLTGRFEERARAGSRTINAAQDENAVVFTRKQAPDFEVLRGYIQDALSARIRGTQA
jgi:hypothetical protein